MKIGVTYKLYKVRITNSDGKTIQLLLGKESYDYLLKLKHFTPGYHIVSLVQPEHCICDVLIQILYQIYLIMILSYNMEVAVYMSLEARLKNQSVFKRSVLCLDAF